MQGHTHIYQGKKALPKMSNQLGATLTILMYPNTKSALLLAHLCVSMTAVVPFHWWIEQLTIASLVGL
jgi:hypothetical protein